MARARVPLLIVLLTLPALGADWLQFRGPHSSGIAPGAAPPVEFGPEKNVAWKAKLPGRGLSSPVIVGDRVYLTASSGDHQDRLHVLAFDAGTGKQLWQRTFWATGPTGSHPKTCMAAPTPASDGRRLVAFFATNDLICLDLDGNPLWVRSLYEENPGATDGRGLASSPLIVNGTVVILCENQNVSFAAGIDLETGHNRWRIERPRELTSWTSPIRLPGAKPAEDLVLLQGYTRLSACDPATGREVWALERKCDPISSALVAKDLLFVPGDKGLVAYRLQTDGSAPKQLWENVKLGPTTASPLVLGDRVYCLRGAILVSGELGTGTLKGQTRLKGPFAASPVAAGTYIYCVNEEGLAQVVREGQAEDMLAGSGACQETILATPAIAGGALYLRSDKHLWKIAG